LTPIVVTTASEGNCLLVVLLVGTYYPPLTSWCLTEDRRKSTAWYSTQPV
jgi:hypothetical protein